jgi:biotin carboxylase
MDYPLVVKPTDAGGSRDVTQVHGPDELGEAFAFAAAHSPSGQVVVEKFLDGVNLTVNVFMAGGEIAFSVITEKEVRPGSNFLIGGHIAPARLSPARESALLDDASRLCAAFDLTDGPANFDVVVSADGHAYFLEAGARMSGNGFPQLVQAFSGVNCVAALVDLVTGLPVRLAPSRWQPTRLWVLASPLAVPGELIAVEGLDTVAQMPGVASVDVFAQPDDVVQPFTEAGRKLGWIVVTARNHAQLESILDSAVRALGITVGRTAVTAQQYTLYTQTLSFCLSSLAGMEPQKGNQRRKQNPWLETTLQGDQPTFRAQHCSSVFFKAPHTVQAR